MGYLDAAIRDAVHAHASPPLTAVMRMASTFGAPEVLSAIGIAIILALLLVGRKRPALLFAIALAGTSILDPALKLAFHRTRPPTFFGTPVPNSYSFPSGHAMYAACFFGFLAVLAWQSLSRRWLAALLATLAAAAALLIGLSRIYLGVHYPSDVAGGYAVVAAWLGVVLRAGRRYGTRAT